MNIYQEWNFRGNPFKTTALPAEVEGDKLIAGRNDEIRQLTRRLYNQPQIPTIEGLNGIGKTSLINVAVYRSFQNYMKNRDDSPLFIPCNKSFQVSPDLHVDEFIDEVYLEIAQTLIKYKAEIKALGIKLPSNIDEIGNWLNSPYTTSYEGGVGALTVQLSAGKSLETNTSKGFERNGFHRAVKNWLNEMFPSENSGGIVCVIDNLELLEKSATARKMIEILRDKLFVIKGIRWVMCGSLGIVTSLVSSPRLEGLMHDPIQIGGILKMYIKDIFNNRINAFKTSEEYYLPITEQSFIMLYDVLKWNIRNTLKYANDYCTWIDDKGVKPSIIREKEDYFIEWLTDKSNRYYNEIHPQLNPRTLKLFKDVIRLHGNFSLSDYDLFEYKNPQSMRVCIKNLESVGMVISVIDENDNRRKSIQVTPKGWFVNNAISN